MASREISSSEIYLVVSLTANTIEILLLTASNFNILFSLCTRCYFVSKFITKRALNNHSDLKLFHVIDVFTFVNTAIIYQGIAIMVKNVLERTIPTQGSQHYSS